MQLLPQLTIHLPTCANWSSSLSSSPLWPCPPSTTMEAPTRRATARRSPTRTTTWRLVTRCLSRSPSSTTSPSTNTSTNTSTSPIITEYPSRRPAYIHHHLNYLFHHIFVTQ